jgi:DNA-binding response OmpR family regulator
LGGWDVLSVASIQAAAQTLRTIKPDAIILDAPNLGTASLAILKELRSRSSFGSVPIILISAKASWFTPQQLQAMKVRGAIARLFNPIILTQQVVDLLH